MKLDSCRARVITSVANKNAPLPPQKAQTFESDSSNADHPRIRRIKKIGVSIANLSGYCGSQFLASRDNGHNRDARGF